METQRSTQAIQRAEVILRVRSGAISASEGSRHLGVSRKTYYEWERRGLAAMMEAVENGVAGRPSTVPQEDPETAALRTRVASLEKDLETAKQTAEVRRVLELCEQQRLLLQGKKNRRPRK